MSTPIIPEEHARLLVWLATAPVKELRDVDAHGSPPRRTREDLVRRITFALTGRPRLQEEYIIEQLVKRGLIVRKERVSR